MASFAGVVFFDRAAASQLPAQALLRALGTERARNGADVLVSPGAIFGNGRGGDLVRRDGRFFVATSRIDNAAEIARRIGADPRTGEAELICAVLEREGDEGVAALLGVFALAHWDERSRILVLGRDCVGDRSLFYHVGHGFCVFASNLATLLAIPVVPRQLDERMLANFLALNHHEQETTFYRGISRVPSRTIVRISATGIAQRHYWRPRIDAGAPYRRDQDYIERARELFDRAVARNLRATPRAAVLLSGGLDSSAVAATAARLDGSDIVGYTAIPPAALQRPGSAGRYLDEGPKVLALNKEYPSLQCVFVTPREAHPWQGDPGRLFLKIPMPVRNVANLGWFERINERILADGHRVVLTGLGGNASLSCNGHLALAALLSRGRVSRLWKEARASAAADDRGLLRTIYGRAVQPLLPTWAARFIQRARGIHPDDISRFSLLRPEVAAELNLRQEWRRAGFDPSYRTSASGSAARRARLIFDNFQIGRDWLAMRFEVDGLEFRAPFADRELVEFCLSVPEELYLRGGVDRWFARAVFADRLPHEILDDNRRGEQAPNWFESLDARKQTIIATFERLQNSRLAGRLIDLARLEKLIAAWPKNASEAEDRRSQYRFALDRAVHVGQFIRWVEGANR